MSSKSSLSSKKKQQQQQNESIEWIDEWCRGEKSRREREWVSDTENADWEEEADELEIP